MVLRTVLSLLFLAAAIDTGVAALDLTPITAEVVEDGISYRQLAFKSDDGTIALILPGGWTASGQTNRIQLTPANKSFADAAIEAVEYRASTTLDQATVAAFKRYVISSLPQGSQIVTNISEAENITMPGGYPSFEVVISYQLFGKTFHRSALLVNRPNDRLIFRLSAPKEDFPALAIDFRRSMMSWRFTEAKAAR